jgi:hypothetical protein
MGGRLSGALPREEGRVAHQCGLGDEEPYQATDEGSIGMAISGTHASRQQVTA